MEGYVTAGQATLGRVARDVAAPPQPSQVQIAQSNLDSCINTLHEALSALEHRLHPVLTAIPEKEAGTSNNVRPIASTVSQRITDSSENIAHITSRVQRLLDRLEV